MAFFLVQIALYIRPQLPAEVRETALSNYASSTLNSVDCENVLSRLNALMQPYLSLLRRMGALVNRRGQQVPTVVEKHDQGARQHWKRSLCYSGMLASSKSQM